MCDCRMKYFVDPRDSGATYRIKSHPEFIDRMIRVAHNNNAGLGSQEAVVLWEDYSDSVDAGWLGFSGSDEELWMIMQAYFK